MFLLEAGLAAWRLTRMLVRESGPNDIFARMRAWTGIEYDGHGSVVSYPPFNPLHCQACTGMYVSLVMVFLPSFVRRTFAIAAVAALVEMVIRDAPEVAHG